MPTSYEEEILKIYNTTGAIETLDCHQVSDIKQLICKAKDAQKRASQPDGPPSPYDFTPKELELFEHCWYFCCKWLQNNLYPPPTKYGATNDKKTKKNETALLQRAKEIAQQEGTVRPTKIKLSQVIDRLQLKKIVQLAESSNKPSILITAYGYDIAASNGRKAIASDENQLQIENPPTQLIIKLNATQN